MLSELLTGYNTTLDPWKLVLNLFLAVLLGFVVSLIYMVGIPKADRKMARLFPVLAAAMTLASSLIASSLGIAIGLVGALSIIRFRTVVHDLDQMVFLFMAIGAGLAASTGQFLTGAIVILAFGLYILSLALLRGRTGELIRIEIKGEEQLVAPLLDQLSQAHPKIRFESLDQEQASTNWQLSCTIYNPQELFAMREKLGGTPGITYSLSSIDEGR